MFLYCFLHTGFFFVFFVFSYFVMAFTVYFQLMSLNVNLVSFAFYNCIFGVDLFSTKSLESKLNLIDEVKRMK